MSSTTHHALRLRSVRFYGQRYRRPHDLDIHIETGSEWLRDYIQRKVTKLILKEMTHSQRMEEEPAFL